MRTFVYIVLYIAVIFLFSWIIFGFDNIGMIQPLLPPLIAIGFSFITKNVIFSLFCGIYVGVISTIGFTGIGDFMSATGKGLLRLGDTYLVNAIADRDHASILTFTATAGGMIAVIARSGGLNGIVEKVSRFSRSAMSTQILTNFMGILIFFDDYSNLLIVGNTMRPLSDKYNISREKLSFIVDSTAAPIASLMIISAWIGYELGVIGDALRGLNIPTEAYILFLNSIPYRFYAIILIIFIFLTAVLKREFGPMYSAEQRARFKKQPLRPGSIPLSSDAVTRLDVPESIPKRWYNAGIPIATLVIVTVVGIYFSGFYTIAQKSGFASAEAASLRDVLGNANPFAVLIWGALSSSIVAIGMVVVQRIVSLGDACKAWIDGVHSMVLAMIILVMAWSLSAVIKDLKTAEIVASLTGNILKPELLPLITFLLACIISFSTGTSYGTMGILFPLIIPLFHKLTVAQGVPFESVEHILNATVGAVLTGAIFGDHCSPISDTTILSSMCSAVDHLDHVRTQMVYALVVGAIATMAGYLPAGFGLNPYICNIVGIILIVGILILLGKNPEKLRGDES